MKATEDHRTSILHKRDDPGDKPPNNRPVLEEELMEKQEIRFYCPFCEKVLKGTISFSVD